jgi:DNA-binding NtrC family response regulator
MLRKKKILVVDDDKSIHLATKYLLKEKYDCFSAYNGDEARIILQNQSFDVILLDIHMRVHEEGLEYLPKFKEIDPDLDVIIVSSNTELDLASRAIRLGASAYLVKEHSAEQLIITIESVLNKRELVHENRHYIRDRKRLLEKSQIIGQSPAILRLHKDIEKIRNTKAQVIITAETGCGKELVARHLGAIEGKPFVAVDSSTIMSSMAESMLFGHEKGAFTGAASQSKGLFEEANGGTFYFDEISNMPLDIQAKILRVIQEKEIVRLGSTKVIPLEFRVICASNKDLEKMIEEGKFKEDLYQRLNVINLRIPPLRERSGDISLLLAHFLEKHRNERSPRFFSATALEVLEKYTWPGNVRELSNLVANLCTMVIGCEQIEIEDLPEKIQSPSKKTNFPIKAETVNIQDAEINQMGFYQYMKALEGKVLNSLYESHQRNISQMSKNLNISRSHLYSKLYAHGIHQ